MRLRSVVKAVPKIVLACGVIVAAGVASVTATRAISNPSAGPSPEPRVPIATGGSVPDQTGDPRLLAAADVIEPLCQRGFPEKYSGIELDHARHEMIIYRKPSPQLDAAVMSALSSRFPGITVVFRDATHSQQDLGQLRSRIEADRRYWLIRGVDIRDISVPQDGKAIELGTLNPDHDRPLLHDRYGTAEITVRQAAKTMPL